MQHVHSGADAEAAAAATLAQQQVAGAAGKLEAALREQKRLMNAVGQAATSRAGQQAAVTTSSAAGCGHARTKHVGQYQSCMVDHGRLIRHAS